MLHGPVRWWIHIGKGELKIEKCKNVPFHTSITHYCFEHRKRRRRGLFSNDEIYNQSNFTAIASGLNRVHVVVVPHRHTYATYTHVFAGVDFLFAPLTELFNFRKLLERWKIALFLDLAATQSVRFNISRINPFHNSKSVPRWSRGDRRCKHQPASGWKTERRRRAAHGWWW